MRKKSLIGTLHLKFPTSPKNILRVVNVCLRANEGLSRFLAKSRNILKEKQNKYSGVTTMEILL